jgi:hypothetical protein
MKTSTGMRTRLGLAASNVLIFILCVPIVQAQFLSVPQPRWSYDIQSTIGVGNNVMVSSDGSRVFVTAIDGTLHILSSSGDPSRAVSFVPPPSIITTNTNSTNNNSGTSRTTCRTGVTLVEDNFNSTGQILYAVYAVTDEIQAQSEDIADITGNRERYRQLQGGDAYTGTDDSYGYGGNTGYNNEAPTVVTTLINSRIFGVDKTGALLWTFDLPGKVIGEPYVSRSATQGDMIYIIHNVPAAVDAVNGNTGAATEDGRVSVISVQTSSSIHTATLITTVEDESNSAPFGPATGRTFASQDGNTDVLYFGTSLDDGFSSSGSLYALFALVTSGTYFIRPVSQEDGAPRSTLARPAVSSDGTSVYLGQSESLVQGWTGGQNLGNFLMGADREVFPRWGSETETDSDIPELCK